MEKNRECLLWFQRKRNFLHAMRLLALFLFGMGMHVSATTSAQNVAFTFELKNATFEDLINEIRRSSDYYFIYKDSEVAKVTHLNKKFISVDIQKILEECLEGTGLIYSVENNVIMIRQQSRRVSRDSVAGVKEMTIKGIVKDEDGYPLPGATILFKGTKRGSVTDMNGRFNIKIPRTDSVVLVISFIGMKSHEVNVSKIKDLTKDIVVRLMPDVEEMDEVVVTGYGNVKKTSFTGSSISVKGEDLLKVSQSNIITALQTFDPSFRIQKNNQWGSDPNALPEMYIRGRSGIGVKELDPSFTSKGNLKNNPNLPTFIMDGFEVSVEKVYDLDPTRIDNITILKDAAATAMYGSRAANGVVVITTVAPKPGEVMVQYSLTGSVTMPDLSDYNLANAKEKLEIEVASGLYDTDDPNLTYTNMLSYYRRYELIAQGIDTDWMSIPLRNALNHKHSLYIEGGSADLRYGLDFSYNNNDGVMKESYRNTTSVGFFVDYHLKDFLQVKNYISYGFTGAQNSPYGSFSDYTRMLPFDRPYNEDGSVNKDMKTTINGVGVANPLYESTLSNFDREKYDEFIDNLSLNWLVNDFISVKGQFSVTKKFGKKDRFVDPLSSYVSAPSSSDNLTTGDLYTSRNESTSWDTQLFGYFQRSIDKHNVNFSLGMNAKSTKDDGVSTHYRGFPSGLLHSANYAAEVVNKPSKSQNQTRLFGAIASLNYTYNDVYLLDASARVDGSSEFGRNQKYAPFWSGGFGLNIHNYDFMKDNGVFEQLKLKATYGQTGKVNFPAYCATTVYEAQFDEWYITGYGVKLKALGNADLAWEKTNTLNIGADINLFGIVTLIGEWYNKKTVDLITDVTIPTSSGFISYKDNLGEISNKGFEIQLRADVIKKKDLFVSLWGNMAHNKNKILKISESLKAYNDLVDDYYKDAEDKVGSSSPATDDKYSKTFTKYEEGGSTTSIFGMKSLGIDPANGKELFENRDGSITHTWKASHQSIIGNTEPKAQGAFGFNASYKNFSLFASFMFEFGGQEYNQTLVDNVENADVANLNVDKRVLTDRWQKPGDVTMLKDIKDRKETTLPSSRFIQDNDFVSLNALTLSYDFNTELVKKWGISMIRLEASTNDIVRFSTIKQERGTSYPYARTVNFSLKVNF